MLDEPGEVDATEALGKVAAHAVALHVVVRQGVRAAALVLEEDVEEPRAVVVEDLAAHDEHVAEIALGAREIAARDVQELAMALRDDVEHALEVLYVMLPGVLVLRADARTVHEGAPLWHDEVIGLHVLADGGLVVAHARQHRLVIGREGHIGEVVGVEAFVREQEVATVVHEPVIVGITVLPSPILCRQLAEGAVELGDVVARIIAYHAREVLSCEGRPHLDGFDERAVRKCDVLLVAGDEQFDDGRGLHQRPPVGATDTLLL